MRRTRPRTSTIGRAVVVVALVATTTIGVVAVPGAAAHGHLPGGVVPAPTDGWIDAAHRLFLGRDATTAERDRWRTIVHVRGPEAMTAALAVAPEWAGRSIDALYRDVLGRQSDEAGRSHWLRLLAEGLTLEAVAAHFYGSEEFYDRHGREPGRFVDALYRALLERASDPAGRNHWIEVLGSSRGTRSDVAAGFFASPESRGQRVDRLYQRVLGHRPDPAGRRYWTDALASLGDVALAAHLAASDEFHLRATGVARARVRTESVGPGTSHPLTSSWRPGCPVGPEDLVAVVFDHFDFDGRLRSGVFVVHADAADAVAALARTLHGSGVPLRQARPVDDFGGDDDASMAADNSSAFNCRTVAGTTTWSRHAFGRAVDLNPVENPYVRDGSHDPPSGAAFADRDDVRPGMVVEGGPVVATIDALGWGWGGRWASPDHQHMSASGR